jgi:hypothetical protein
MGLSKQAKTLNKRQTDAMLAYLTTTRHPTRNRLIFLLFAKARSPRERDRPTTNDSTGQIGHDICLVCLAERKEAT